MSDHKTNNLLIDRIAWVLIMIALTLAAFTLMRRDMDKQFGAISYGAFPKFKLNTLDGKLFDDHEMKGHVWAVHLGTDDLSAPIIAKVLAEAAQSTWTDKRHLFVLSLLEAGTAVFDPMMRSHYIVESSADDFKKMASSLGSSNVNNIFLVDQNGIIRGIYDSKSSESLRRFNQDVLHLI